MAGLIKKAPIVGPVIRYIYRRWLNPPEPFLDSETYWQKRYISGGNSGSGSYGRLAKFKADFINEFVSQKGVTTVIEYGCGDGNQLGLSNYSSYIGFDVSPAALAQCKRMFAGDRTKAFKIMDHYKGEVAELTLTLDVIFHLTEDDVFANYMHRLFDSSKKYVIVYSSNTDENPRTQAPHVKHRAFTAWVNRFKSDWKIIKHVPNKYPFNGDIKTSSFADFYVFEKVRGDR